MVEFKLVISDPKERKAYQVELKSPDADIFLGKKIGEIVKGEAINAPGFELRITGGSDKEGFPMRADVMGTRRIKILLSQGTGIKTKRKGERRRKSIRGNQIADDISQINLKVVKQGKKQLGIVLGKEEEKVEEKTEEKKEVKEEPKSKEKVEKPKEEVKEEKTKEEVKEEKSEKEVKKEKSEKETSKNEKEEK